MPYYLVNASKGHLFIRTFNTKTRQIDKCPVIILSKVEDNLSIFFIEQATSSRKTLNHEKFFAKVRETPSLENRTPMISSSNGDFCGNFTIMSLLGILQKAGFKEFTKGSALEQLFISFYIFNAFRDHTNLVGVKHKGRYVSTEDFEFGYKTHIESIEKLTPRNAGTVFDEKGNIIGLFNDNMFVQYIHRPT